jgi:hypothetical protein
VGTTMGSVSKHERSNEGLSLQSSGSLPIEGVGKEKRARIIRAL